MNILPEGWCNCIYSVGGMMQMHLFYLFYQRYDGIVHTVFCRRDMEVVPILWDGERNNIVLGRMNDAIIPVLWAEGDCSFAYSGKDEVIMPHGAVVPTLW
jgi:hypothetical protein